MGTAIVIDADVSAGDYSVTVAIDKLPDFVRRGSMMLQLIAVHFDL